MACSEVNANTEDLHTSVDELYVDMRGEQPWEDPYIVYTPTLVSDYLNFTTLQHCMDTSEGAGNCDLKVDYNNTCDAEEQVYPSELDGGTDVGDDDDGGAHQYTECSDIEVFCEDEISSSQDTSPTKVRLCSISQHFIYFQLFRPEKIIC